MNNAITGGAEAATEAIATVLLDSGVKGFALLLFAGMAATALRRRSASVRHFVWFLGVLSLLVLPVMSLSLPDWRMLPRWLETSPEPRIAELLTPDARGASNRAKRIDMPPVAAATNALSANPDPTIAPASITANGAGAPLSGRTRPAFGPTTALLVWFTGAAAYVIWLGAGLAFLRRLERSSTTIVEESWTKLVEDLRRRLRIAAPISLLRRPESDGPMTWGVRRPKILLPNEADGWPDRRRQAVLTHELAHVKRMDFAQQALAQLACALHWFNPLVWYALRRLRIEREQACDDRVLEAGWTPIDYAEQLLAVTAGQRGRSPAPCPALAMARTSRVEGRLRTILDESLDRRIVSRTVAALALGAAVLVVLPIAMLRASPEREQKTERASALKASLPGDGYVEVVGVTDHPPKDRPWWNPDGSDAKRITYDATGRSVHPNDGELARDIVLRVHNPRRLHLKWKVGPFRSGYGISALKRAGKPLRDLHAIHFSFPQEKESVTVKVGYGVGDWRTPSEFVGPPTSGAAARTPDGSVAWGNAYEKEGKLHLTIAHSYSALQTRIVVTDRKEREHLPTRRGGSGGDGFMLWDLTYGNLQLEDVKQVRFQTRPYQWIEFRGISLWQRGNTKPRVVAPTDASGDARSKNTPLDPEDSNAAVGKDRDEHPRRPAKAAGARATPKR